MPAIEVNVAAALPKLVVAGDAVFPDITGVVAATLPLLQVAGLIANDVPSIDITVATTLPLLQVAIVAPVPDVTVRVIVTLPRMKLIGRAQGPPSLTLYTGQPRANGGTLVVFRGIPYRSLEWEIVSGSGTLLPLSNATDFSGFAYCRYNPGAFVGVVEIGAIYVP